MVRHDPVRPPPRVVTRLVVDFVLASVRAITRHLDGDILGGLAVLALLQIRNAQMAAPSDGGAEAQPHPISVQSLAHSLKTPPETMRRCVARLIDTGWCARVPGKGVIIADGVRSRAVIDALMADIRNAFWRMITGLRAIGFDFDLMDQASAPAAEGPVVPEVALPPVAAGDDAGVGFPERSTPAIDRAILDFGLRIVDAGTAPHDDDYVRTCVFAAIMSANASPFAYDPALAWEYATHETPPPDSARRPVTLAEIAQLLGIPYETARRYVNALVAKGYCVRDARKMLLIPMELLQTPEALLTGLEMVRRFVQMVADLKRLGFDFRSADAPAGSARTIGSR